MYEDLVDQGYNQVQLVGIGKSQHMNSINNWTSNSNLGVCADQSPYMTWNNWGAAQRDLFILDSQGDIVYHENITNGFSSNEVSNLVISLIPETTTCDEIEELYDSLHAEEYTNCEFDNDCVAVWGHCDVGLGECHYSVNEEEYPQDEINNLVNTWNDEECMTWVCDCSAEPYAQCLDGTCTSAYCMSENPAGCFQTGCDEGYECIILEEECVPSSCFCDEFYGDWFCTEDCGGGTCYLTQVLGDINNDTQINVLDVVLLVGFILGNEIPDDIQYFSADINSDGSLNVLDVVSLVGIILGN